MAPLEAAASAWRRRRTWAVGVVVALAAVTAVALPHGRREVRVDRLGPVPAGALWLSPRGSDAGPGTRARPWRTLRKAVARARPGATVVLEPGSYGARGTSTVLRRDGTAAAPITFRGRPDAARPRILGAVRVRASHVRLAHMLFDGPTGPVQPRTPENPRGEQVEIAVDDNDRTVDDLWIYDCEIRNSAWHAGIFLADAADVAIVANHIHDNGDPADPGQANQSHGIYWASGSGVIADNVVDHNVARGIQLYPRPAGVVVTQNTIVGNGRAGVQVANDTRDTLIVNNIVVDNGDAGIRSDALRGSGNVARTNLLWHNGTSAAGEHANLAIDKTIAAPPGFAPGGGFRLSSDSAAVDRGQDEGSVAVDGDGRRRPQGDGPDLGAFESR